MRIDGEQLEALAASIREHGVLQPILVTETLDGYQLVAGERRFRAAQLAGLERIPAVVRQLADREQLELALVENLQREDLEPDRRGRGLPPAHRRVRVHPGGRSPRASVAPESTVANTLRLLDLDPTRPGSASPTARSREGHARALGGLPVEQQARVADTVIEQELSVRQTEELVRRLREPRPTRVAAARGARRDPDLERVEEDLRRPLGTKVTLARSRKGGRIVIEYYSDEELGQLYDRLIGGAA